MFTMLLSAIVVSIFYSVYIINYKNLNNFKEKSSQINQIRLISTLLEKDFNAANQITFDSHLKFYQNDSLKSGYKFNDEYILRTFNASIDTFNLQVFDISKSFLKISDKKELISKLHFKIKSKKTYNFSFSKVYDAKQLILWEE